MKWNALNIKMPGLRKSSSSSDDQITDTYILFNREYSFYPEDYFRGMLIMERKRSERSGKPFMLMQLNISKLEEGFKRMKVIKKLIKMMSTTTREIDIKGWYKLNLAIGILYTEINDINKESLIKKMVNNIKKTLGPKQASLISISCLSFPEEDKNREEKEEVEKNAILYRDSSNGKSLKRVSLLYKKLIDITGSLFGILLFSPFLLIIPILIKLTSKGPVFFKQERVGLCGKKFHFLKFRTMYVDNNNTLHKDFIKQFITSSDDETNGSFKMEDDPRVTQVGKFLRKSSLDELPQFFNVLKGDMSLVGPRPAIPYEIEEYDIWHRRRVLEVKPGITGIWQVNGRSRTNFDNMVRMDIQYIERWSPLMDIKLIFQTPWALLTAKGAY